jgi:hypothetical protein
MRKSARNGFFLTYTWLKEASKRMSDALTQSFQQAKEDLA